MDISVRFVPVYASLTHIVPIVRNVRFEHVFANYRTR